MSEAVHVAIVKLKQLAMAHRDEALASVLDGIADSLVPAAGQAAQPDEVQALRTALYRAVQILGSDDPTATSPAELEEWSMLASGGFEQQRSD